MTKEYLIETNDEEFVIDVPDDAEVVVNIGGNNNYSVRIGRRASENSFSELNVIAFYNNVRAIRCNDEVKRQAEKVA